MNTSPLVERYDWSRFERVVVLSPHLDDAALSCGGLLHALQGRASTLVVTICCGTPPGRQGRRGHVSPRFRRREDIAAMHSINADFVHLSFADGVFRRSPLTGKLIYRSARERWLTPRVDDFAHVEELYLVLRRICLDLGRILLVSPMGVGHHVDHQITAQTAVRLSGSGAELLFYEDFPYVIDPDVGREDEPLAAMARLRLVPLERLVLPIDAEGKARLLGHYATQLPALFDGEAGMREAIASRTHEGAPCEVFWRAAPVDGDRVKGGRHAE